MASTNLAGEIRVAVLIPAAGQGRRMGAGENKTLLKIGGLPVIARTVQVFLDHPEVERVVIIARGEDIQEYERVFATHAHKDKIGSLIKGGKVRQDSVWRAITELESDPPDWVLVHDGVRPFCSPGLLERVLLALREHPAVVPVLPVTDTVRRIEKQGGTGVVDRDGLLSSQTPQGFHWNVLRDAFIKAGDAQFIGTDDAQLVEAAGQPVHFVCGEGRNIKITNPEDLSYAQWVLDSTDEREAE